MGNDALEKMEAVTERYRFAITPYVFSLIDWSNFRDPIRLQVVPDVRELESGGARGVEDPHVRELDSGGARGVEDPLAEEEHMPVPGLIHRYPDRVVMLVNSVCAVYCRHCNRKRNWNRRGRPCSAERLRAMTDYLRKTPAVREVILSGGDPLLLATAGLGHVLDAVYAVPHVDVVRIGTRVPAALPMRVTDELCELLARYPSIWVNTHFNHPDEVTPEAEAACRKLQRAGIPVNNQTVLLKGVNDAPQTIIDLCHKLEKIRVRPYYLFQCDQAIGTEHFWTSLWTGVEILRHMIGHTGGLCVPRFVVDLPGGKGKVPLMPNYIQDESVNCVVFKNYQGIKVVYSDSGKLDRRRSKRVFDPAI